MPPVAGPDALGRERHDVALPVLAQDLLEHGPQRVIPLRVDLATARLLGDHLQQRQVVVVALVRAA